MPIQVNGTLATSGKPGTYVTLDRTWSEGDTITFRLPMDFKLTRYTGVDKIAGHERYALEYGPVLLAILGSVGRQAGGAERPAPRRSGEAAKAEN